MSTKVDDDFIEEVLEKLRGNKELARKLHYLLEEEFVRKVEIKEILEEIKQLREESNKRWEESNKRWEESNKRWEELMKEFKERSKQVDNRFDKVDDRLDKVEKRMEKGFTELKIGLGYSLEQLSRSVVIRLLESLGYESPKLEKRHFEDPEMTVHKNSTDVEVDFFSEEPLVIGEATGSVKELQKIERFLRKVQFVETKFNKKAVLKVLITYKLREDIQQKARAKLQKAGVELITIDD